jgi:ABC-type transport system involved in multi-copper enzyme maturation permease subunit
MIWKIAKKEFLLNLMTFKFAVGTILCIVLMAIFVPILTKAYQERLKVYNENIAYNERELGKVTIYKNITPTAYRPPSVLAVFSEGLEKQIGNSATIEYDKVPEISGAVANHYLSIFSIFDASLIFEIVISVLALLVAYDAISGERERGTLKLMLSGAAARYQVLLGKLLAGLMLLIVLVTITFILGLFILLSFPMVDLGGSDWIRIGFMFFASLVFIATMYNLGLLFSCMARRSTVSLVLGLFLWIIFVVVVPNGSAYLAAQILPIQSEDKINEQIASLRREAQREVNREKKRSGRSYMSGSTSRSDVVGKGGFGHGYIRSCNEVLMHNGIIDYSIGVPIYIKYADKYSEVKFDRLRSMFKQTHLSNNLSRISPISLYDNVMSALAGTDMVGFQNFIDNVKVHRKDIIEYVRSRTNNFSSSTFFTPCTKEEMKTRPKGDTAAPLELQDLPRFVYKADIVGCLLRAIPDLALLILGNALFFAIAYAAFLRYDVR